MGNINREKILGILTKNGKLNFFEIAKSLHVDKSKNLDLTKLLRKMVRENIIFIDFDNYYYLPHFLGQFEGPIHVNSKGYGFVDLNKDDSVFILKRYLNTALNKDQVLIRYFKDPRDSERLQGIVERIIKRNRTSFVASIKKIGNDKVIMPIDSSLSTAIFLMDDWTQVKENMQVKLKMVRFAANKVYCELEKVIGEIDDIKIDILSAIEDSNIPFDFPSEVKYEAHKLPKNIKEEHIEANRRDFRDDLIVTIDGDDTKDFDDAVNVKKLPNNNYLLSVHIADVTHYVKEKTAIDDEALLRGTSVYLVDRVIPMLPEELSNNICSLNPKEDRFTISAQMEIDSSGQTVKYEIFPAIINSKYRLTYNQVNDFLNKNVSLGNEELDLMIKQAYELSKIIRKFKEKEGYIDFEIIESKIIVDDQGKVLDIIPRPNDKAENLIEDFMVRANETVAIHAEKNDWPFIFRVHDKPDLEKLINLENVVRILELDIKIPRHAIPSEFAKTINQIKELRFDDFMKTMMLRTMAKAVYSSKNIGHFGLASEHYTHFTSPIRRYPDLMVHRMLRDYFFEPVPNAKSHYREILPAIADSSSMAEQRSMELERKVDDMKKAQFYKAMIGQSLQGQISSVNKFGFFVDFPNKAGGLVRTDSLIDGPYEVINKNLQLKSKSNLFTIGDFIDVTIVGVNQTEGKVDLVLTSQYETWKERQLKDFETNKKGI